MGKIYQVKVFGLRGEMVIVDLCSTEEEIETLTVLQLKEKILQKFNATSADSQEIRLIFIDKLLDDDSALLSHYGIQHMSVILMIRRMQGGGFGPERGDGGMGDKEGKNRSMERLMSL